MFLEESILKLEFVNQIDHPIELLISSDDLTVDGQPFNYNIQSLETVKHSSFRGFKHKYWIFIDPATGNSQFSIDYDLTLDLQPGDMKPTVISNIKLHLRLLILSMQGTLLLTTHGFWFNQLTKTSELYDKVNVIDPKLTFTHNGFGIPLSFSYDLFGTRTNGLNSNLCLILTRKS